MKKTEEKKYLEAAKMITTISTPAIVGGALLFYALYELSPNVEIFLKTFFSVLTLSIILPVLFIFYLMKKGKVGNFHLKEREDRALPFGFTLIAGTISLVLVRYFGNDPMLIRMFLTFFLMALGYSVITFLKYKISGHVFIFSSAIFILVSFIDLRFIYLLPLVIPIGWARVYQDDHTTKEVVGGFVYALISFLAFSVLFSR